MRTTVAVLLVFTGLSLAFTYPLPLHVATAVEDRQDALLNVWITAWDGHQLLADPAHLFNANIFYPYPRTLAYSELLLGNALLALPITAVTGNPLLGYNLALLLSFILSGFGVYLLVLQLTRRRAAGLVAGLIFAFSSYRLSNLAQAQLLATQWLPFTLLALHQLLERPRLRTAAVFMVFFWLQTVSSFYYGLMLALAVIGFWILDFAPRLLGVQGRFRIAARRLWRTTTSASHVLGSNDFSRSGPAEQLTQSAPEQPQLSSVQVDKGDTWRSVRYSLLAAGGLLMLLLPFVIPYFEARRELGFERTLADSEPFSASLYQYVLVPPGSVLHGRWLPSEEQAGPGGYPVDALFPGIVAVGLAAIGVIRGRGRERWLYLVLLLAAGCLSLGPRLYLAPGRPAGLDVPLPYAWLYAIVPGFKALRAPVRFDALLMLALAVLAGYGVAGILDRRPRPVPGGHAAVDHRPGSDAQQVAVPVQGNVPGQEVPRRGWRRAAVALLAALVILESLVWPGARAAAIPAGAQVPAVYRWLAAQPHRPILELPMAFTEGGPQLEYQYLSTYHWQPTPDGYSGFLPPRHGEIVYEMERFPSERSVRLLQALGISTVVLHGDRWSPERWAEIRAALEQVKELSSLTAFGPDVVVAVQSGESDPGGLQIQLYVPPQVDASQPLTAYAIAVNHGGRSYAIRPTDRLRPSVEWETPAGDVLSGTTYIAGDPPLVISGNGGAAVVPFTFEPLMSPGIYRLTLSERDGTWGTWQATGTTEAGAAGDPAFPIPARLTAWQVPPTARAGQPLRVDLAWQALGKIDAYYSVYVKLLDAEGNAVAGWDGQPRSGQAPTLEWVPGETVTDTITLDIPAGTAPGDYTLEVGMYRAEDLARCLLLAEDGALLERVVLGHVAIRPKGLWD